MQCTYLYLSREPVPAGGSSEHIQEFLLSATDLREGLSAVRSLIWREGSRSRGDMV
jgi:hypothetical protein